MGEADRASRDSPLLLRPAGRANAGGCRRRQPWPTCGGAAPAREGDRCREREFRPMTGICRPRAMRLRRAAAGLVVGCWLGGPLGGCTSPHPSGRAQRTAGTDSASGALPATEIPPGPSRSARISIGCRSVRTLTAARCTACTRRRGWSARRSPSRPGRRLHLRSAGGGLPERVIGHSRERWSRNVTADPESQRSSRSKSAGPKQER